MYPFNHRSDDELEFSTSIAFRSESHPRAGKRRQHRGIGRDEFLKNQFLFHEPDDR
jgi:hypothetical protein